MKPRTEPDDAFRSQIKKAVDRLEPPEGCLDEIRKEVGKAADEESGTDGTRRFPWRRAVLIAAAVLLTAALGAGLFAWMRSVEPTVPVRPDPDPGSVPVSEAGESRTASFENSASDGSEKSGPAESAESPGEPESSGAAAESGESFDESGNDTVSEAPDASGTPGSDHSTEPSEDTSLEGSGGEDPDDPVLDPQGELSDDQEIYIGYDRSAEEIVSAYTTFISDGPGKGKVALAVQFLTDLLPIDRFYATRNYYHMGPLTVFDEGFFRGEEDMLRYHTSQIYGASPEKVGIYDSYEQKAEMDFTDTYNLYCRTYTKEGVRIYAVSECLASDEGFMPYDLYFQIEGIWFRLYANGYTYPNGDGVLRSPDEWPEGVRFVTEAQKELSDVSTTASALILGIRKALE